VKDSLQGGNRVKERGHSEETGKRERRGYREEGTG
jgi:hypothetical protein